MLGNIIPFVLQSERFFREAWPQISQSVESGTDAARHFSLDAHRLVVVARK
jgi:hypothetical protein